MTTPYQRKHSGVEERALHCSGHAQKTVHQPALLINANNRRYNGIDVRWRERGEEVRGRERDRRERERERREREKGERQEKRRR